MTVKRQAFTAIEVLAATVLAALLMTALIGVLRGLKAQEQAIASRSRTEPWQQTLDSVLQADLSAAHSYEFKRGGLWLYGYGGKTGGVSNWQPAAVVYEVRRGESRTWLVRRSLTPGSAGDGPANIALADVDRVTIAGAGQAAPSSGPVEDVSKTPLTATIVVAFWGSERTEPLFEHRNHDL